LAEPEGVRTDKKAFKAFADWIDEDVSLPKYYVNIQPRV
jgi:hypothetical protein